MRLLPAMFTFRRNVVIRPALAAPDPADLGTAFGLDACLLDTAPVGPPALLDVDEEPVSEPPLAWLSRRR